MGSLLGNQVWSAGREPKWPHRLRGAALLFNRKHVGNPFVCNDVQLLGRSATLRYDMTN